MINIAAIIDNLGPSQKSFYLIKEFNKTLSNSNKSASLFFDNSDICASVFFKRSAIPVVPVMFSCKNISFLSGYHDIAICTTLDEAQLLLKSDNSANKYLYLWDIEWLAQPYEYDYVCNILLDNRLKIITRSQSHSDVLYNFCNKKSVGIVDNWNLDSLINITYLNGATHV